MMINQINYGKQCIFENYVDKSLWSNINCSISGLEPLNGYSYSGKQQFKLVAGTKGEFHTKWLIPLKDIDDESDNTEISKGDDRQLSTLTWS